MASAFQRPASILLLAEIGEQVLQLLFITQASEGHGTLRHHRLRIGQVSGQAFFIPGEATFGEAPHIRRIAEAFNGSCLAAHHAPKIGANAIAPTLINGMAGAALVEHALAGIRILGGVDFKNNRFNALIVAISIGIGMIPLIAPNFKQWMPHNLHPLIESGILLASISAVALNLFFNGASADSRDAIEAAKQAEAH